MVQFQYYWLLRNNLGVYLSEGGPSGYITPWPDNTVYAHELLFQSSGIE